MSTVSGSVSTPPWSDVVVNRCLLEGRGQGYEGLYSTIGGYWSTYNSVTLQNGVVRENWGASAPWAGCGVALQLGANHRIVNNEIYNLSERLIQIGHDGGPDMSGFVVENNDLYATSSFDGGTQGLNSVKAHATSAIRLYGSITESIIVATRLGAQRVAARAG